MMEMQDHERQIICGHLDLVMWPGGKATYRVGEQRYWGDHSGRWIGFVGNGADEHGDLLWWAVWREDGDAADRWSSGLVYGAFTEARDGLLAARAAGLTSAGG